MLDGLVVAPGFMAPGLVCSEYLFGLSYEPLLVLMRSGAITAGAPTHHPHPLSIAKGLVAPIQNASALQIPSQ